MDNKKKKTLFTLLVVIALIILIGVGSTFAYFSSTIESTNVISTSSAQFQLKLEDNGDLIKTNLIPSIEEYVDIASKRVDENGNFLKPYKDETTNKMVTEGTTCIDDNKYEICSIYTFTVKNPNTDNILPLYITLTPSINTFENLYYKVLDSDLNEVIGATQLIDNRYKTYTYTNPKNNKVSLKYEINPTTKEWVRKENFNELKIEPYVLTNINKTLPKATDENTPSEVTYHIVMWIMETHDDQTDIDSGKIFASKLTVSTGPEGTGITGTFSSSGTE